MTDWMRPVLWMGEKVLYELQPKQNEAYSRTPLDLPPGAPYAKHIGYGGAAGGGKSHLARAVATVAAFRWPGSTGVIFRRTKQEVKDNHVKKFFGEVPRKLNGKKIWSWNGEELCATFEHEEEYLKSRIYFGYLKDFSDVDRYQGLEFDYMVFEEATHYAWDTVRWLTGNRLRATKPWCRPFVLYPSNPGNVGHFWYKRLFIERRYNAELEEFEEDFTFIQAKLEDNKILVDRDPTYIKELNTLPEPYRSWLRDGDWEAGLGLALTDLNREKHFIDSFDVPESWHIFGGFDWGYEHPWVFGLYAMTEDRRYIKLDTLVGRHQQPLEIIASIKAGCARIGFEFERIRFTEAGHDCWADHRARGENVPTIAEHFASAGLPLRQANISRVSGLNCLRRQIAWKDEGGTEITPNLLFVRTEGNNKCFQQLESMPVDPDKQEDALKSDADLFGQGGDDFYDETRYALASRAPPSPSRFLDSNYSSWDPKTLAMEAHNQRMGKMPKMGNKTPAHIEFGEFC